ncbi:MAG: hypothetical protein ACYCPT_10640 [Acidimicrobiales bacterium]
MRGHLLATDGGDKTNGEFIDTVGARATRHHRDVLLARIFGRQASPCEDDQIPIGPVGLWLSQEVFLVGVFSFHQGPPRRGKSMVTLLSDEARKLDGRIDQADEEQ